MRKPRTSIGKIANILEGKWKKSSKTGKDCGKNNHKNCENLKTRKKIAKNENIYRKK